jgi:putative ABC transport system substrate-binding protein
VLLVRDTPASINEGAQMRRRDFLKLLAVGTAWPFAAAGQERNIPVIGFLGLGTLDPKNLVQFHRGLNQWGFVEGQNLAIEYQWATDGQQISELAAKLVQHRVALIVASGGMPFAKAAKEATSTIPILFSAVGIDPVEDGVVASLSHPGGNVTGLSLLTAELLSKRLELLQKLVPAASKIAYLMNDDSTGLGSNGAKQQDEEKQIAGELGLRIYYARNESEIDTAFAAMAKDQTQALLVASDPVFGHRHTQISALSEHYHLPTGYTRREYVDAGGLMSYGPSFTEAWRQIGEYAGRLLKGARPQDLPVQLENKYELVVNMRTAKTLGLTVPPLLHAIADEVIE